MGTERLGGSRSRSRSRNRGAAVWTVVALLGAAAVAYVIARRIARGEDPLDADALLDAADRAANNLDSILRTELTAS